MTKHYLTSTEFGKKKNLSKMTVNKAVKQGRISPAAKIGRIIGFEEDQELSRAKTGPKKGL